MPYVLARALSLSLPFIATLVATLAATATPARAGEVAPQISLSRQLFSVSTSHEGLSISGETWDGRFSCFVAPEGWHADGTFECTAKNHGVAAGEISGRVVGVTNAAGTIVGHRIRFRRVHTVSSPFLAFTLIETYSGSIARGDGSFIMNWTAGEYTSQQIHLGRSTGEVGPFPFTGAAVLIPG